MTIMFLKVQIIYFIKYDSIDVRDLKTLQQISNSTLQNFSKRSSSLGLCLNELTLDLLLL